jgi:hypothetical protein
MAVTGNKAELAAHSGQDYCEAGKVMSITGLASEPDCP